MNKKMFIICAVFALIISCKNYTSGEDLKQNLKKQIRGFLDIKKEGLVEGLKNLGAGASSKVKEKLMQADNLQGQLQEQVTQDVNEDSKLKDEIEKEIQELKNKMKKSDGKTPICKYCEYEEEIKEIRDKLEDKEKLEKELKELEESLKKKKEGRKKALEDVKKKFEEFKGQVSTTTGETHGHQVQNQGKIGGQAWAEAKKLGLNGSYSNSTNTNSNNFANEVIGDVLKKIEEELKKLKSEEK